MATTTDKPSTAAAPMGQDTPPLPQQQQTGAVQRVSPRGGEPAAAASPEKPTTHLNGTPDTPHGDGGSTVAAAAAGR